MKSLSDLLLKTRLQQTAGDMSAQPDMVTMDSRQVRPGSLFVAVKGSAVDGHLYIPQAISKGATAIVCEHVPEVLARSGLPYAVVQDSAQALGEIASAFYGYPSRKVKLVAVTGTNGKTTVATLLYQLFTALGYRCGLLSTVRNLIAGEAVEATHTTPDAVQLNALLAKMVQERCTHVFMEASSHAIHQRRIASLDFDGAVFTNITHDHLDYHQTFANYIAAKRRLFDDLPADAFALTNVDEKRGRIMVQNTRARVFTYGLQHPADFKGRFLAATIQGNEIDVEGQLCWMRLPGRFNAYNAMAVYGAAVLLGEQKENVLTVLSGLAGAPGRFETIRSAGGITAIVDYAHTPDALKNVLETIKDLRQGGERIITVVGCGGDRDAAKRPEMGAIAARLSDKVVLTSDNPRSENPEAILDQMAEGIALTHRKKVVRESDRREAIRKAIEMAMPDDIILIAGKGHEPYQEIAGIKHPFDDREIARELLNAQANKASK